MQWLETLFTCCIVVMAVVGVLGNAVTLYIYLNKRNRTSTENLIASIALVDLLSCAYYAVFSILKKIYRHSLPYPLCFVDQFVMWVIPLASMFLMASISVNRLVAVVFPLNYPKFFNFKTLYALLLIIGAYSSLTGSPFALLCMYYHELTGIISDQAFGKLNIIATLHVGIAYTASILVIALSSFMTSRTLSKSRFARKQANEAKTTTDPEARGGKKDRNPPETKDAKLTKALVVVAVAYVVLCTPFIIYTVVFRIFLDIRIGEAQRFALKTSTMFLYVSNYIINPFTYYHLNDFFRGEVGKLLGRHSTSEEPQSTYQQSTNHDILKDRAPAKPLNLPDATEAECQL